MKIAFFDAKDYDKVYFNKIKEQYGYKYKFFTTRLNPDTAIMAKGYDVVCVFVNDDVNKEVIDILVESGVKLIALRCAGYNNVDFKYAFEKIYIVRVPAYSPYAVAEHAFALISTLTRKTHKAYLRTRESNFNINGLEGFDLYGKTIGIVGLGKIGQIVSNIALGYGMKVLAFDAYPKDLPNVKYTDMDTLLKNSDIISLHCPLTKETNHLINEESIMKMKTGVMIINTSRGALIDTESLIEGLKNRKIGYAGLDVYEEEANYFFTDFSNSIIEDDELARLLSFNNVLVTSHQAFLTAEALSNISSTTLENIKSFIEGKALDNEVCYQCEKFGTKNCKKKNGRCF